MKVSEVVPPLVMLALSAVVVLATWHLGYWRDTTPGPAFAPVWVAAAGILLALLQLRAVRSAADGAYDWPDVEGMKRVLATFLGLVAFAALSPLLSMVLGVALFVVLFLYGLMARPLLPSLMTAAVTTAVIYFIFVRWLDVGLPAGYFGI
jgi:putative tricarboxylic transport membrane protein